ncbi:RDD family protein [Phreatobacter sp.]|uniref:RDD family protein n=1 Tax=Phreatobacter sp. TaxID=1966341 RepID=UPI003F6E94F9
MAEPTRTATWRVVVAYLIDIFGGFLVFGYVIGLIFGGATDKGFSLQGWRAILLFVVLAAYVIGANRYIGGTIGKRIMRVSP